MSELYGQLKERPRRQERLCEAMSSVCQFAGCKARDNQAQSTTNHARPSHFQSVEGRYRIKLANDEEVRPNKCIDTLRYN